MYGQVRTATKRVSGSGGRSGGTAGKRLGVKKFSDEQVIPGNIIVRQRGTHFHPGQHVRSPTYARRCIPIPNSTLSLTRPFLFR